MSLIPEVDGATIVILGSFNPAIFHPIWYEKHGLIRAEEAEEANIKVVHSEVSEFSAGAFRFQVLRERFMIGTGDPSHFEPMRDLVLATFEILEHTPVSVMGLNRNMHFRMPSTEKQEAFCQLFAPVDVWSDFLGKPGLRSLKVEDPKTDMSGFIGIKIEPSKRIEPGIYFEVNNHYEIEENDIKSMLKILRDCWEKDVSFAWKIAEHYLNKEY